MKIESTEDIEDLLAVNSIEPPDAASYESQEAWQKDYAKYTAKLGIVIEMAMRGELTERSAIKTFDLSKDLVL